MVELEAALVVADVLSPRLPIPPCNVKRPCNSKVCGNCPTCCLMGPCLGNTCLENPAPCEMFTGPGSIPNSSPTSAYMVEQPTPVSAAMECTSSSMDLLSSTSLKGRCDAEAEGDSMVPSTISASRSSENMASSGYRSRAAAHSASISKSDATIDDSSTVMTRPPASPNGLQNL